MEQGDALKICLLGGIKQKRGNGMKRVSKFLALFLAGVLSVGAIGSYSGNSLTVHAYENAFYNGPALAVDGGDTGLKSIAAEKNHYYTLDVPYDGKVTFYLTGYNVADCNFEIFAYDKPDECLDFCYFMNKEDETSVYKYTLSAGKYVVAIMMKRTTKWGKDAQYQMKTRYESYGKNTPKDSYNNPKTLTLGKNHADSLTLSDDADWYKFTLSEATYCKMRFKAIGKYVDCNMLDGDLQKSYGFFTCYCDIDEEHIIETDYYLPAGTYMFKVYKSGGIAKYDFTLSTTKVQKSAIKKLKVKAKNKVLTTFKEVKGADGYQIRYSTSKKFTKKTTKTKTISENKVTRIGKNIGYNLTKLKKNKNYYVQVRAFVEKDGVKYFSDWSKTKKIIVK